MVRGHPNFAQGFWVNDTSGNIVRIIDFIRGKTLADHVAGLGKDHEDYFHNHFPLVLHEYMELVKAIRFLHERDQRHGDVRRDHAIRDREGGHCRWIDFDFNYLHKENMFGYDLFGLGNILAYLVGRGDVTTIDLRESDPQVLNRLSADDMNIVFNNRVVNLRKIYPYIPEILNRVLLHFSVGANIFYDNTDELLTDLEEVNERIGERGRVGEEIR